MPRSVDHAEVSMFASIPLFLGPSSEQAPRSGKRGRRWEWPEALPRSDACVRSGGQATMAQDPISHSLLAPVHEPTIALGTP
jgi:hypothetical protein